MFPLLYRFLFARIGFGWSVRVSGFLMLVLCAIGNATVTSRIRPGRRGGAPIPLLPGAKIFRDAPFILLVAGCFFVNFGQLAHMSCSPRIRLTKFLIITGLFIPITYLSNYAISRGVPSSTSFYIVSALNGGSIVGRIVPAFLADVVGRFNIAFPSTFVLGLLALVFWTFAKTLVPITAFAVIYGCFAGAFLAMQIPCVSQISDIEEVGTRIGILYSVASFA